MAEQFIIKRSMNSKKEVVEHQFRIDADFVPTKSSDICVEFIQNYCESRGQDSIDWLCDKVCEKITDKNGKEVDMPFISLRAAFVEKYFPQLLKTTGPKAMKMKDMILARFKKK